MIFFGGITDFIFIEHQPVISDIIFVPGGSYPELMETAAGLWHRGFAPFLLPSGKYSITTGVFADVKNNHGRYPGPYATECDFYLDVAKRCGVPQSCLLAEYEATYTMQNACFSREVTDKQGLDIKKALICCKSYHARRAYMYYQYAFPDTELAVIPVDVDDVTRNNWHETEYGVSCVMGEVSRCGSQFKDLILKPNNICRRP